MDTTLIFGGMHTVVAMVSVLKPAIGAILGVVFGFAAVVIRYKAKGTDAK